ncbi:type II CAAX endopeptidase family protein [Planococcus sp. N028]|uniref:Type II CAAX endopeptidase family protein n=1 Tax=Planococcus shixiaomingii TaxID=3058393 RepID=A0ABT8N2S9_9BACL|nr:type II CAAX endopeptidase family protein [Planococcus sp. N028]MDN7242191.1 type II CAAX endopeptidase family protein [Planococcus sp. N028]
MEIRNCWPNLLLKLRNIGLFMLFFAVVFLLQNTPYPHEFHFIAKQLDRIDFGRGFHPESSLVVIVFVFCIYYIFFKSTIKEYFSLKPFAHVKTYIGILLFLLVVFVIEHAESNFNYIFQFNFHPFFFSEYAILYLITAIITPIEEELVFRAPLLLLFKKKSRYVWLLFSCIWFTLIHQDSLFALIFSLGLSLLTLKYKNIWIPILAHVLWNSYALMSI